MAKRGRRARATSLDGLVGQLQALNDQRRRVINQIRAATDRLLAGDGPFGRRSQRGGAATAASASANGEIPVRRRKRRKMSAEAREKIAAAQRARWAKHRKAAGKNA